MMMMMMMTMVDTDIQTDTDRHLSHLYDVIEDEEQRVVTSQWDFAASLLFAITVITTIGKSCE